MAVVHWALLLLSMWDLPGPVIEPVSPALADRFSTSEPQGKPLTYKFNAFFFFLIFAKPFPHTVAITSAV